MSSRSTSSSMAFSRRYAAALRKRLAGGSDGSARTARILGRDALASGLEAMDLVKVHARALIAVLPTGPSRGKTGNGQVARAAEFFIEALTPIDAAHRAARKRDARSNQRVAAVKQQALDLASTRKRLKSEIGRREAVEVALRKSQHHYGQLLERSTRMQEHLRRLSHEILSAHEEERKKISRELHDEIGQTLTAINVKLATLKKEATVSTADLKKKIASTQRLLERSMNTVHRFARDLRPPLLDDLGLIPALHSYMKDFTKRTGIPIRFSTFATVELLNGDRRTVLYRVAQEALVNVTKHAQASLVTVSLRKLRGDVCMEIHDNGKSFHVERALFAMRISRLGLLGMRERVEMVGGTFTVESTPEAGTTIRALVPFHSGRS